MSPATESVWQAAVDMVGGTDPFCDWCFTTLARGEEWFLSAPAGETRTFCGLGCVIAWAECQMNAEK